MGETLQSFIVEFRLICENLFFTFLILKLTSVVTWSWWVIFSPLIVLSSLILFFLIMYLIFRNYGKRREEEIVSESN